MTPTEFKTWFDGFAEAISGAPDERQWNCIKARVAEIGADPASVYSTAKGHTWTTPKVTPGMVLIKGKIYSGGGLSSQVPGTWIVSDPCNSQ